MNSRTLLAPLTLATLVLLSTPAQAWWGPWGGPGWGPWGGGFPGWGPWSGPGWGPWGGYPGWGPGYGYGYGYPLPYAGYLPSAVPANAAAPAVADSDNDGVGDNQDLCADTPAGTAVDFTGCAQARPITLRGVNFKLDSAELTPESSAILDRVARTLASHPQVTVEVGGHTDSQGDAAYNLDLSARRAATVVAYLIEHGVPGESLTSRGYGETLLIDTADTPQAHATNRRVELTRTDAGAARTR